MLDRTLLKTWHKFQTKVLQKIYTQSNQQTDKNQNHKLSEFLLNSGPYLENYALMCFIFPIDSQTVVCL